MAPSAAHWRPGVRKSRDAAGIRTWGGVEHLGSVVVVELRFVAVDHRHAGCVGSRALDDRVARLTLRPIPLVLVVRVDLGKEATAAEKGEGLQRLLAVGDGVVVEPLHGRVRRHVRRDDVLGFFNRYTSVCS